MRLSILLASAVLAVGVAGTASAWGALGHEVVIKVAERHLTPATKAAIARYMPYDLATDAVWMDHHRNDREIAYTSKWHGFHVDRDLVFDPNGKISTGDVITALNIVDYNLRHRRNLTDSAMVMNLRMVLHFIGDLHCPTHVLYETHKYRKVPVVWNGKRYKNFHNIYDKIPHVMYGKRSAEDIASEIDDASRSEVRKITNGTYYDWANQNARDCEVIYLWNPEGTTEINPNTMELSRDLVNRQLRNGGYRLARLLNDYFD